VTLFGEMVADYMPGFERLSDRSDYFAYRHRVIECIRHGPFCKLPNVRKRSLFACRSRQLNTWKFPTTGQVGTRSELHRPDTKTPGVAEIHLAFHFGQRICALLLELLGEENTCALMARAHRWPLLFRARMGNAARALRPRTGGRS
jgi:hypothetical protein